MVGNVLRSRRRPSASIDLRRVIESKIFSLSPVAAKTNASRESREEQAPSLVAAIYLMPGLSRVLIFCESNLMACCSSIHENKVSNLCELGTMRNAYIYF